MRGRLHHLELWVEDLEPSQEAWSWLLAALGYVPGDAWATGLTWRLGDHYVVLEAGPDVVAGGDRRHTGMNHVALWAADRSEVDAIAAQAPEHGWRLLFADAHPFAGGPEHYAAYLEDPAGIEVEIVAPAADMGGS